MSRTPIDAINAALVDEIFYQPFYPMKTVISAQRHRRTASDSGDLSAFARPKPSLTPSARDFLREFQKSNGSNGKQP